MPTAVEHSIIAILKPFDRGTDVSLELTGLPIPGAVDVHHEHTSAAVSINFTLTDHTLSHDIQLLVPAVQHTDFLLG